MILRIPEPLAEAIRPRNVQAIQRRILDREFEIELAKFCVEGTA